jgi:hypothetical protein
MAASINCSRRMSRTALRATFNVLRALRGSADFCGRGTESNQKAKIKHHNRYHSVRSTSVSQDSHGSAGNVIRIAR